jgi:hypothetical protein
MDATWLWQHGLKIYEKPDSFTPLNHIMQNDNQLPVQYDEIFLI